MLPSAGKLVHDMNIHLHSRVEHYSALCYVSEDLYQGTYNLASLQLKRLARSVTHHMLVLNTYREKGAQIFSYQSKRDPKVKNIEYVHHIFPRECSSYVIAVGFNCCDCSILGYFLCCRRIALKIDIDTIIEYQ